MSSSTPAAAPAAEVHTKDVSIKSEFIPYVVGKGGCVLKEIKASVKSRVDVKMPEKAANPSGERRRCSAIAQIVVCMQWRDVFRMHWRALSRPIIDRTIAPITVSRALRDTAATCLTQLLHAPLQTK